MLEYLTVIVLDLNSKHIINYIFCFRMKNLSAQLAKIEIAQQKKEEIITEKSNKAAEVSKYTVLHVKYLIEDYRSKMSSRELFCRILQLFCNLGTQYVNNLLSLNCEQLTLNK